MRTICILFALLLSQLTFALDEKSRVDEKKRTVVFQFNAVNDIYTNQIIEEEHYLGVEIAKKWTAFHKLYIRSYEVEIGFSNSGSEITKPIVFKSVEKVNSYLKKSLSKKQISIEDAQKTLNHVLDCANAIYFENETRDFEKEIANCKNPNDIISLFNCVKLV